MRLRSLTAVIGVLCVLVPATAAAETEDRAIEERKLASGKQLLVPDKGYIFLHGTSSEPVIFVREVTAASQTRREVALAEARRTYPGRLERWQRDFQRGIQTRSDRPVEPTEENLGLNEPLVVVVGPERAYSSSAQYGLVSYLHELTPGTYRYYGTGASAASGPGLCYCMGSVRFEVEAGKITNLGNFLSLGWVERGEGMVSVAKFVFNRTPRPTDYTLPERLAPFPNERADWRAAGKIGNFLGLMVGRMPAIPGVLAYDRDRVIDLRAADQTGRAGAP